MNTMLSAAVQRWVGDVIQHEGTFVLVPLPSHSDNRVFRVEAGDVQYVLKLVAPGRVHALAHERAITEYLAAHDFPVAPVLAITDVADHEGGAPETAALRIAIPGVPLTTVFAAMNDADRDTLIGVFATVLARVHRLPLTEVCNIWQYPEDRVDASVDWSTNFVQKKIASDLARITDALPEAMRVSFAHEITAWGRCLAMATVPLAPLHGDYYGDNVLIAGNAVTGVLDWEAARLGDPMWDLARTEAAAFANKPEASRAFSQCMHGMCRGRLMYVVSGGTVCSWQWATFGMRYVTHLPSFPRVSRQWLTFGSSAREKIDRSGTKHEKDHEREEGQ